MTLLMCMFLRLPHLFSHGIHHAEPNGPRLITWRPS